MGGGSGSGGTQETTQKSEPWEVQQPYLQEGFNVSQNLFFGPDTYNTTTTQPVTYNPYTDQQLYQQALERGETGDYPTYNDWLYNGGKSDFLTQFPEFSQGVASGGGTTSSSQWGDFSGGIYQPQYFPGSTVAPFSPETEAALQMQTDRALFGSPLENQATDQIRRTLAGEYLDPATNPGFQTMAQRITEQVMPAVDAKFANSGRYGSGMHNRSLTTGLADSIGALAYQNYGDERTNMARAMFAAPEFSKLDWERAARLGDVGVQRESYDQSLINEAIARYNYEQQYPLMMAQQYMQMISGNYGGTSTGTAYNTMPRGSTFGSALGGGLSGAGTGYMISGGNPYGALVGGGIGLLGGLF